MTFDANSRLTDSQIEDGRTKRQNVCWELNKHFYGAAHATEHSMVAGSWGKETAIRPPHDVDVFFGLPPQLYFEHDAMPGNGQSALLQKVRTALLTPFPQTEIRGDGQVVVVGFNSVAIEIVPAFERVDGTFWICDTNDGGRFKLSYPREQMNAIEVSNILSAGDLRPLIRMVKVWKRECNVSLPSFVLEVIATNFIDQSPWRANGYFYFDWSVRDFFSYLIGRARTMLPLPGESYYLGDDWKTRAERAHGQACLACEYERADLVLHAGDEWQKIFGAMIPKSV